MAAASGSMTHRERALAALEHRRLADRLFERRRLRGPGLCQEDAGHETGGRGSRANGALAIATDPRKNNFTLSVAATWRRHSCLLGRDSELLRSWKLR
jgi:hypothetical protein